MEPKIEHRDKSTMTTFSGNFGVSCFVARVKAGGSESNTSCKGLYFPIEALSEEFKLPVKLETVFEFGDDTFLIPFFGAF